MQEQMKLMTPSREQRRKTVLEKQEQITQQRLEHQKMKVERDISNASEKRKQNMEIMQKKLRNHIQKVEEIRKTQMTKRKESTEKLHMEIEHKLTRAGSKREENLEKIKETAIQSAEKKKNHHPNVPGGESYLPGENIPLKKPEELEF